MILNTALELLMVAAIVVFIIDVSGFKETFLNFVSHLTGKTVQHLRPFTCSLCMTWWMGILWLLLSHSLNLYALAVLCIISALTRPIAGLYILLIEAVSALWDWLMEKL